ncbi:hypothetical protein M1N79_01555 [Dehalococcoidia bacterium]|nr:hypothetical protein [Dehalococcoidia bacterium]
MKKRLSLAILALLMLSMVAVGCPPRRIPAEPPPQGPYPAPSKEWSQTFGGPYSDTAYSVQQTACGGFIIAGTTESFGAGKGDFWLVKTDPLGNKEWGRTFGGPYPDEAKSVRQTTCGGFIIAGRTSSFGAGESDFWLIKTDPDGNKEWSRTFGGADWDGGNSVQQMHDGGFIMTGWTRSFGAGESDFWLIKTDPQGNEQWSQTFGGADEDRAASVQETACGGFIMAGRTESFGAGLSDLWLVKTDAQGDEEWTETFGRRCQDIASAVQQTADGGFIIAGHTCLCPPCPRLRDFWLIKTDPQGNEEWSRTFGARGSDRAWSVQQTADGGFVIAGDITTLWISRSVPLGAVPPEPVTCIWVVNTDPHGNIQWTQNFGTLGENDEARSVKQTACGGFIIAGYTSSFGAGKSDFWLIKLASEQ